MINVFASLVVQTLKRLPAMRETRVRFLGREDPLEKEMAIHSSTLAWKIPWTEELDRLQSMGPQRVRHDWATSLSFHMAVIWACSQPSGIKRKNESRELIRNQKYAYKFTVISLGQQFHNEGFNQGFNHRLWGKKIVRKWFEPTKLKPILFN